MKKISVFLSVLCLTLALTVPASALDCVSAGSISLAPPQAAGLAHSAALPSPTKSYDFAGTLIAAPGDPEYGKSTSSSQAPYPSLPAKAESSLTPLLLLSPQSQGFAGTPYEPVVTADRGELPNVDVSKNAALIPPTFGSPTAYTLNTGVPLTPNLAPRYMLGEGTIINSSSGITITPPDFSGISNGDAASPSTGYTEVTPDLYYNGGHLGTLKIPSLKVSVRIYQGTDSKALAKGAGHFPETSIWDGNVAVAGHNRGTHGIFGDIHTLEPGDKILLSTKLGTRTYQVTSISKVNETDRSGLAPSGTDMLTLYTCVRNQSAYRWQVTAEAV